MVSLPQLHACLHAEFDRAFPKPSTDSLRPSESGPTSIKPASVWPLFPSLYFTLQPGQTIACSLIYWPCHVSVLCSKASFCLDALCSTTASIQKASQALALPTGQPSQPGKSGECRLKPGPPGLYQGNRRLGNILIRKASRVSFTPSLRPLTGLCSDSQLQLP